MKVSGLILSLQRFMDKHGDLDVKTDGGCCIGNINSVILYDGDVGDSVECWVSCELEEDKG